MDANEDDTFNRLKRRHWAEMDNELFTHYRFSCVKIIGYTEYLQLDNNPMADERNKLLAKHCWDIASFRKARADAYTNNTQ
jgi:DUF1365 family protein